MKMLKFIGMIALIFMSKIPSAPSNYTKNVETGGAIEAKYLQKGTSKVKHFIVDADEVMKKHLVYYPAELKDNDKKYPVIFSLNGTGIPGSRYPSVFEHFASWGFIVLGNEDPSTGSGVTADKMYEFLITENSDKNSILYNKVDFEKIGLIGHSQGGAGVFSALSIAKTSDKYRTGVALSPTHEEAAHALTWMYDLKKVNVPILMFAGTETDFETQSVIPIDKMNAMFDKIHVDTKVMARRVGSDHGKMLYSANGYAVAWFMWQLQENQDASKAFSGKNPEILNNNVYQNQRVK